MGLEPAGIRNIEAIWRRACPFWFAARPIRRPTRRQGTPRGAPAARVSSLSRRSDDVLAVQPRPRFYRLPAGLLGRAIGKYLEHESLGTVLAPTVDLVL